MTTFRCACLFGLVLAGFTSAAAPPPRPLAGREIERLIEQMGSRSYHLRDQAERRLRAEGVVALPYLRKAIGHKDLEIRRRALRMVPGLEHAVLVAPKRITMTVQNQHLSGVIAELSKQSGYKIILMTQARIGPGMPIAIPAPPGGKEKGEKRFNYSFLNSPFWEVIDRICRDSNLTISSSWGDDTVRLTPSAGFPAHAGRDGAFRFSASSMQLNRHVDLSTTGASLKDGGGVDNLTFQFELFAEPRLPFLSIGEVRVEAAYDSERNSMLVPAVDLSDFDGIRGGRMWGGRYYRGSGYKQMTLSTSLPLQRASRKATSLKVLRGVVPVSLLVEQKQMLIADKLTKAKGKKTRIGDLEFLIESVEEKKAQNQVSIKFTVSNKGAPNDYTWQNNIYQRLELVDAKGEKFQNWGSNWHGNSGNNLTMTLTFNQGGRKLGTPDRFFFQHWVTRQHNIQFEFKDIPLP